MSGVRYLEVGCTKSELRELVMAWDYHKLEAVNVIEEEGADFEGSRLTEDSRLFAYVSKNTHELEIQELSNSYPSTVFHYSVNDEYYSRPTTNWYSSGKNGTKSSIKGMKAEAFAKEVKRFFSASSSEAEGVFHKATIMPEGNVITVGINRFGECNTSSWTDIVQISCGNWHTVGLRRDGTLVACGSNANGQCNVGDIKEKAVSVTCGRYHTATLTASGKVVVCGSLEQQAADSDDDETPLYPVYFPLKCRASYNLPVPLSKIKDKYSYLDTISLDQKLKIRPRPGRNRIVLQGVDAEGEVVFDSLLVEASEIMESPKVDRGLARVAEYLDCKLDSVYMPTKSLLFYDVRLDLKLPESIASKAVNDMAMYKQTKVDEWDPVTRIISVYDAVIGISDSGEMFAYGFCPCSENDIRENTGLKRKCVPEPPLKEDNGKRLMPKATASSDVVIPIVDEKYSFDYQNIDSVPDEYYTGVLTTDRSTGEPIFFKPKKNTVTVIIVNQPLTVIVQLAQNLNTIWNRFSYFYTNQYSDSFVGEGSMYDPFEAAKLSEKNGIDVLGFYADKDNYSNTLPNVVYGTPTLPDNYIKNRSMLFAKLCMLCHNESVIECIVKAMPRKKNNKFYKNRVVRIATLFCVDSQYRTFELIATSKSDTELRISAVRTLLCHQNINDTNNDIICKTNLLRDLSVYDQL